MPEMSTERWSCKEQSFGAALRASVSSPLSSAPLLRQPASVFASTKQIASPSNT